MCRACPLTLKRLSKCWLGIRTRLRALIYQYEFSLLHERILRLSFPEIAIGKHIGMTPFAWNKRRILILYGRSERCQTFTASLNKWFSLIYLFILMQYWGTNFFHHHPLTSEACASEDDNPKYIATADTGIVHMVLNTIFFCTSKKGFEYI